MKEFIKNTKVREILFYNRRVYASIALGFEAFGIGLFLYHGLSVPLILVIICFLLDASTFIYGWVKTKQLKKENELEFSDYEDLSDQK